MKTLFPFWKVTELEARRLKARSLYKAAWTPTKLRNEFRALEAVCLEKTWDLMRLSDNLLALISTADFFETGRTKKATKHFVAPARFMTIPLLSEATLKLLGEDKKLAEVIVEFINPDRFPWVITGKKPGRAEVARAVAATAELWALQVVDTEKRNKQSKRQEEAAKQALTRRSVGLTFVARTEVQERAKNAPTYKHDRGIESHNLNFLLKPGEFTNEFKVAGAKCDLPVLLPSGFFLPIECKVSGSDTNSVKRVTRETVGKRAAWRAAFGNQPYTGAVISGDYALTTLKAAQGEGVLLFFEHDLDSLGAFIRNGGNPRAN